MTAPVSDPTLAAGAAVAADLAAQLAERGRVGSAGETVRRFREIGEAQKTRDPEAVRAAVFEMLTAAAEWCVALDLAADAG